MAENDNKKGTMAKDTIIYMLAKAIEGIVGVLTVSVLTYLYMPEQMGQYSTVNIAVTTIAMFAIQWLSQSVLRYINKYDVENEQEAFYTTVFTTWFKANMICILIGVLGITLMQTVLCRFDAVREFMTVYNTRVLSSGLFMLVTYNTAQLIIAMLAAVRKTRTNLFISAFSVTGKLLLIALLANVWGRKIEWIFLSYGIFDGITSLIGIFKLKLYKYINMKKSSPEILRTLKAYGVPLMGNLLTTSVLNKSDIYIITWFKGDAEAGIYQTNYSIVASAFTMLSAAIMRGSYPTILRTWSEGKKDLTKGLIEEAARFFLLIAIPAVAGVCVLSGTAARVLFDVEYFEGHIIMGWVALGMMFLGLTEYSIKPWELNAKTKDIFLRSLIGGIVNVGINILFVPIWGYKVAAVSTFIGFFVYFVLAKIGTRKYMKWHVKCLTYFRIILSAVIMDIFILVLKHFIGENIITLALMVVLGMIVYAVCLYATGEIKKEVKTIVGKLRNK